MQGESVGQPAVASSGAATGPVEAKTFRELLALRVTLTILAILLFGGSLIGLSQLSSVPSLASGLMGELGRALCASAVVALAYEYYLRRSFDSILRIQAQGLAHQLVPVMGQLSGLGIAGVHANRDAIDWRRLIRDATDKVKIIGTSLGYWASLPDIADAFQTAKRRPSCKIQLLAQEPSGTAAGQRGKDIGVYDPPEDPFRADIRGSIGFFKKLGVEVSPYEFQPPFVIAIIDGRVFCGLLAHGLRGRECIHLEFNAWSPWARRLETYFDETWSTATLQSQANTGVQPTPASGRG
jgi:hypothetical protein